MTRYFVSYKPTNGRPENFTSFDSALARSLFVISLGGHAEIVKLWEAPQTELERIGEQIDRMFEELPAVHRRILEEAAQRERRES